MALGFQIALVFLVGIGGGFFVGRWVDGFSGTEPLGMLAGVLGGISVAFWLVYRFVETKKQ